MTAMDPFALVGTLLERKVRVDRVVAEGGFGVVYFGRHIALDVPVAIKVMRPIDGMNPDAWIDAMGRFILEAKAIAKVRHPAVVGVMDSGIVTLPAAPQGVPWMVLEWIEGGTLRDNLAKRRGEGGRSRASTLALLKPVLDAMAVAHAAGLVHRDLKPSNVMLENGESARIVDFGTAKLLPEGTHSASGETETTETSRAFSAVCAAPEQLAGTRTGPWTDVYAIALMLTEVLCDASPYPEDDATGRHAAAFDARVRPTPSKLGIDVGAWEDVLTRALAVRPSDRHPNARELLLDLESTLAAPARATVRGRWRRGAIVAALASLGIGGTVMATSVRTSGEKRVAKDPAPAAQATCRGHRACNAVPGSALSACNSKGRCVPVASADCSVLADARARESDDTAWLGALFPTTGSDADAFGLGNVHAIDLARRDFDETMSGIASQKEGDVARPFGVVACNDADDAKRAAGHLVDVGVPAVIGFKNGALTMDLASSIFMPNDVLSLCATSTNPLVTRIPRPPSTARLVYRTTYDAASAASALAAFVTSDHAPHRASRVALVRPKNATGAALGDAVSRELGLPQEAYRDLSFDAEAPDANAQYETIAQTLLAFHPQAVIFSGGRAMVQHVLAPVERDWPAPFPRPRWASIATIGGNLTELVGTNRDLGKRIFGVTPVSGSPVNARFVTHYAEAFPNEHITATDGPNTAYDAFYLLAYASYAAPAGPLTGSALSNALARLQPPALRIAVGIAGIFDAYTELQSGRGIDLLGATGPLDFNLATGEAPFDHAILCVAFDPAGRARAGKESGLVWSVSDKHLRGAMQCN